MMKFIFYFVLYIISLVGIFMFTLFYYAPQFYYRENVMVPDCLNMDVAEAKLLLEDLGLRASVSYIDDSLTKDIVKKIEPEALVMVKENSIIKLYVSNGSLGQKMPNVCDYLIDTAKEKLKSLDLNLNIMIEYIKDSNLPSDLVKMQVPTSDTPLKENDNVVLYVTYSDDYVVIPNMQYWTKAECETFCKNNDINPIFEYDYSLNVSNGLVISQSISKGDKLLRNKQNQILIVLSKGVNDDFIPDIIQWDVLIAKEYLDGLNIKYVIKYVDGDSFNQVLDVYKNDDCYIVIVSGGEYEEGLSCKVNRRSIYSFRF